jgi:hypothetical protein
MRILPLLAVVVASAGLTACSINTAPAPARSPDVVVQPAPAVMTTPAPSSTIVVPR